MSCHMYVYHLALRSHIVGGKVNVNFIAKTNLTYTLGFTVLLTALRY